MTVSAPQGPGTVDLDSIDGGGDGASSEDAASRYFQWLARTAAAAGVSVDVVAAGSAAANVAALAPVAERSGGLLTLQEGAAAQSVSTSQRFTCAAAPGSMLAEESGGLLWQMSVSTCSAGCVLQNTAIWSIHVRPASGIAGQVLAGELRTSCALPLQALGSCLVRASWRRWAGAPAPTEASTSRPRQVPRFCRVRV